MMKVKEAIIMNQVVVILEKTNTGYSGYSPDVPGCVATGKTVSEVKALFVEALEFHREGLIEDGESLPEVLQGEYTLVFKIDIPTFFEWMAGVMTKTGIANITGLNRDLVNHYANGRRKPSQKQLLKIERAMHNLGRDLMGVHLV
jgi:predicted RNase H-like HicB family nuclease